MENNLFEQKKVLAQLEQGKVPVAIYLLNGVRLIGRMTGSDDYVIMLLSSNGLNQLIFKHAILSIVPCSSE